MRFAALACTLATLGCTGSIDAADEAAAPGQPGASTSTAPSGSAARPSPAAPGVDSAGAPSKPVTGRPAVFSCDRSASPDELPLPRLSRAELEGTLRFAVRLANAKDATAIWSAVAPSFANYPADARTPAPGDLKGGYTRGDQSIQQLQIDAMYATGVAIGQELTGTPARLTATLGPCATDAANARACLEAFVTRWGSRVMRYPLGRDDVTYYADMAGATPVAPAAVADVIAAIVNAPETLYRVEHGTDPARDPAPLSAFELASRLSYQFWEAPPDDELWATAQSGSLLNDTGFGTQLQRLLGSPNLRAALDEFVTQWLRLDELPPLDALRANPVFKAFAGAQMPTGTTRDAMIDDALGAARATVSGRGSVSAFLGDRHSYAQDALVAGVYQVAPWNGTGPAPQVPSPARAGLLTRPALLSTGTATTRPIHKGYVVRNAILCQQVPPPPGNVDTTPPVSTKNQTTRQAVAALTGGGVCAACHTSIVNPPGFLTENFDSLGRERTKETVYDDRGNPVTTLPVDTAATPLVSPDDTRELHDALELTRAIDESGLFHSCLARHYFRFTERRPESADKDGCLLSELETAARSGAPMADVLGTIARSPSFKARRFR